MKKVTYEQFLSFGPCWLKSKKGRERLKKYKKWWGDSKTALDILALEEVEADDKLWTVLRPEFIDESFLHEFACRCAERALSCVDNPDPRSIAAIEAKRAWLREEISDDELEIAQDDAYNAALKAERILKNEWIIDIPWKLVQMRAVTWAAVSAAGRIPREAAYYSSLRYVAQITARFVAESAAWSTETKTSAWAAERRQQVEELIKLLTV